jgi:hypothetical protein
MNEKRMKTPVNTGEVSSPRAREAGRGVKIGAEHDGGSEKQGFGVEQRVDKPSDGRIVATTPGKTQLDTMNIKANGESRFFC